MVLREMFESNGADAAFCFGRFNPAHQGHIAVWQTVQNAGRKWFVGTNPNTLGANDPLPFKEKTAWMKAIYPDITGHIIPETSVVTVASKIFDALGKNDNATIAYVTDSQDWQWAGKLLNDYNGKEGPHGYYKFRKIVHVESPRVSSATALRTAARASDEPAFYAAAGIDPKLTVNGKTYFETVAAAVGAHPEKVKKKKKEPEVAEGWSNKMVARRTGQAPTPYSVYVKGKKWRDFADDDHAENVANKLRAKFKADGRDPETITIAPTDYDKSMESLRTENPCWKGYKPVGTKKKGGKTVPNCVPKESVEEARKKKNRKIRHAAYGPGPYGMYGTDAGYSGDGGGGESVQRRESADGEYNDEAGMAQSNLLTLARAVKGLLDTIKQKDNLPEWAQEKIAKAEMMLVSVWDYLQSQKERGIDPKIGEGQTARDKWNRASAEREKKHNDIEAKRQAAAAQGKENMSAAIDRLADQLRGKK
jgi:hypothetical protein